MGVITSHQNQKVKFPRSLHKRKYREEHGLFLVEGIFHVGEAIAANAPVEYILYTPDVLKSDFASQCIQDARSQKIPCLSVSEDVYLKIVAREQSQGTLAVVNMKETRLRDYTPEKMNWSVAMITPQDPGNVGAVLRTINAFRVDALILVNDCVDHYHPTAVRASMGSIFWQPVIKGNFNEFVTWVKHQGYFVYGSSARTGEYITDITSFKFPMILMLGSEREGLTNVQMDICEKILRLPMKGQVSSLNLAVAAGILMYQIGEIKN